MSDTTLTINTKPKGSNILGFFLIPDFTSIVYKMTDISQLTIENLTELASKDLIVLIDNATKALALRKEKERVELARKLQDLAAESGFSLEELAAIKIKASKAKKEKGAPKFRNPNDHTQTWTGKGMSPKWYKELLASGKSEDDLKI